MLNKILFLSLVLAAPSVMANEDADAEACLDTKTSIFRISEGDDAVISMGMLNEWESWCAENGNGSYYDEDHSPEGHNYDENGNYINTDDQIVNESPSSAPNLNVRPQSYREQVGAISVDRMNLVFESLEDSLTLDRVVVNRGNCEVNQYVQVKGRGVVKFPAELKYGEEATLWVSGSCNPRQVDMLLNNVSYTLNF